MTAVQYRVDVEVVAPVNPTEDPDLVEGAVLNLFPGATVERGDGELVATTRSLDRLGELFASQRIQETARAQLRDGLVGDTIAVRLRKQAAVVGVVNFAVDEPAELGDLDVRVRVEEPDPGAFIDELTSGAGTARDDRR